VLAGLTRRRKRERKSGDDGGDGTATGQDSNAVSAPEAKRLAEAIDTSVGAPTHKFRWWEQAPALALIALSAGIAILLILRKSDDQNAWAFAIVTLFAAVLLSYRSAFTIGAPPEGDTGDDTEDGDVSDGE
jgi:hypothetical protein